MWSPPSMSSKSAGESAQLRDYSSRATQTRYAGVLLPLDWRWWSVPQFQKYPQSLCITPQHLWNTLYDSNKQRTGREFNLVRLQRWLPLREGTGNTERSVSLDP